MQTFTQDELVSLVGRVDNQHRHLALTKLLEAYMPSTDVARDLGTTQSYVRKLVTTGRLQAVKVGESLMIDRDSYAEFKATRRTEKGRPKKQDDRLTD